MLAKRKEKDVIDRLLDQIDFHGMTAEELAGENGLLKKLTNRFYSKILEAETVTRRRLSAVMTTTQSKFMFHETETAHLSL